MTTSRWFMMGPTELPIRRATMTLGLMRAERFYRELVVPGIGGIRTTRQVSWSLGAISLGAGKNEPLATRARAIEALANKLLWCKAQEENDESYRFPGTRAFTRHEDAWKYEELKKVGFYVQNTMRQATSRALQSRNGLGFVDGTRFNSFGLTPVGQEMASVFLDQTLAGKQGQRVKSWLMGWFRGDVELVPNGKVRKRLAQALGLDSATDAEKALLRGRLLDSLGPSTDKRRKLWQVIGSCSKAPSSMASVVSRMKKLDPGYANDIKLASSFGRVFDAARSVIEASTQGLAGDDGVQPLRLASEVGVAKSLETLRKGCDEYLATVKGHDAGSNKSAYRFAEEVTMADSASTLLKNVVRRDGPILSLSDGKIFRGPLFREFGDSDPEDSVEESFSARDYRIGQYFGLMQDVCS